MIPGRRPLAVAVIALTVFAARIAPAADTEAVVRALIAAPTHPDLAWSDLDPVRADLEKIYEAAGYGPLWTRDGKPTDQARAVVDYMVACDALGLRPSDYDADLLAQAIDRMEASPADTEAALRFDTALTVGLLRLLRHTESGRVDPKRFGFGLDAHHDVADLPPVVLDIAGSSEPAVLIDSFAPPFPLFRRLLLALAEYRGLAKRTDLPEVGEMPTLHPEESSAQVPALRERLIFFGDLSADATVPEESNRYDVELVEAVKRFQHRHGLEEDGVIGRATLRALRVPLADRVVQLELAVERLRWLPQETPDRYIIVNIPEFRLLAFERGQEGPVMSSEVVVGSAARKNETPILHSEMQYLVFRPYWNVPPTITRNELLPKARDDETYLRRNNMEMIDGRIRQRPGPDNSLGLVKFIFPNRHHVYLHDTPSKALFGRSRRDFSHGCIRVAKPVDLAAFVLRGQEGWTVETIADAMKRGRDNRHVRLERPVAVYLLYSTVIIGRSGELRFYEDIYGHDAELKKVLAIGAPYP